MNPKKPRPICASPDCGRETKRHIDKYCSNDCQHTAQRRIYIERWKLGLESGHCGEKVSPHVRRYLIEKYGERCRKCGWAERNPVTGRVPLNVDHIDGNSARSTEDNLDLLCPNCHSLTPTFGMLNKGRGRKKRRDRRRALRAA